MVLVIIGLLAGVVTVNLPDPTDDQVASVERLAARLKFAADEAILSGHITGMEFTDERYRPAARVRGAWDVRPEDMHGFMLPERLQMTILVEGEERNTDGAFSSVLERSPTLIFTPGGDMAPFKILFDNAQLEISIEGRADGSIELIRGRQ